MVETIEKAWDKFRKLISTLKIQWEKEDELKIFQE